MQSRILHVGLPDQAVKALREMAQRELRDPRAQATVLIIDGLRRAGFDPERPQAATAPDAAPPGR